MKALPVPERYETCIPIAFSILAMNVGRDLVSPISVTACMLQTPYFISRLTYVCIDKHCQFTLAMCMHAYCRYKIPQKLMKIEMIHKGCVLQM